MRDVDIGELTTIQVGWYLADTTYSLSYMAGGSVDVAVTYNPAAEMQYVRSGAVAERVYGFRVSLNMRRCGVGLLVVGPLCVCRAQVESSQSEQHNGRHLHDVEQACRDWECRCCGMKKFSFQSLN